MRFQTLVSRIGKPANVQEAIASTGKTRRELAKRFGRSPGTIGRWMRGVQQPRGAARERVMKSLDTPANRRNIAASELRGASTFVLGRVNVTYQGERSEGTRDMGTVRLTATGRARMAEAADYLREGEYELAEDAMNDAIMHHGQDKSYGPLQIKDWPSGLDIG